MVSKRPCCASRFKRAAAARNPGAASLNDTSGGRQAPPLQQSRWAPLASLLGAPAGLLKSAATSALLALALRAKRQLLAWLLASVHVEVSSLRVEVCTGTQAEQTLESALASPHGSASNACKDGGVTDAGSPSLVLRISRVRYRQPVAAGTVLGDARGLGSIRRIFSVTQGTPDLSARRS